MGDVFMNLTVDKAKVMLNRSGKLSKSGEDYLCPSD